MDQSLRTVATQLLNVSGPDDMAGVKNEGIEPKMGLLIRKPERNIPPRETVTEAIEKVEATTTDPIRRSTNSKYSFFQASHPGQAMAMTEEELERELASTRHTSTIKPKPTTTGGLSTWILLNPPSTTSKPTEVTKKPENQKNVDSPSKSETQKNPAKNPENVNKSETQTTSPKTAQKTTEKIEENLVKITTSVKPEISTSKPEVRITESIQKPVAVQTTTLKVTGPKKQSTTSKFEKPTTTTTTTPRSEPRSTSPATLADSTTTEQTTKSSPIIKKMPPTIRTTLRPKPATSKPRTTTLRPTTVAPKATTIKAVKPGQPRPSKPPRKATTPKPEVKSALNVTSKIEKVTFKPVHMITTPRSHIESVPKPTFSTKIQASIQTEEKSASKFAQSEVKLLEKSAPQSAQSAEKPTEKPVQKSEKPMKVHIRKPVDTPTKIEIEPIKVNPPILTIEKIGIIEEPLKSTSLEPVDSSPESTSQATTEPSTTTKKPKSKRKKHKTRRRKPSTTAAPVATSTSLKPVQPTSTSVTVPTTSVAPTKKTRKPSTTAVPETSIQESKLAPETNSTKLKKKQTSKPLSSQIYSFLSREVMPSVGVMSLVGLGLGLASYFLYPFGGVIARRNYEVEPNYKYNPEEYGGSYGQSEEDVLKNVFQGMTPTEPPHTSTKDFDRNYYRYQSFGDYTTRRPETRYHTASVPVYRPDNTPVPYEPKYEQKYDPKFEEKFNSKYNKNTDYKYPQDVQTTPTYFDRSKPDFTQINVDRQFVVGSIPKGYGSEDKQVQITTEAVQTDFEKQIAQNLQFVGSPGAQSFAQPDEQNFAQPDAQALRADGYEEIEITPTAVAVEHGPRSLNLDKSAKEQTEQVKTPEKSEGANNSEPTVTSDSAVKSAVEVVAALKNRRKRESVIQLIPSRAEMEKEEHEFETEEPLSNEILDIIDSALPGDGSDHKKKTEIDVKINEIEPKKEITTQKPREDLTTSGTTSSSKPKEVEVDEATKSAPTTTTTTTTTTTKDPVKSVNMEPDVETFATTPQPEESGNGIVNFLRKVAEFKFRLGLTVLKHASESFARYLGHVQKRMNGEE